MEILIAKHSGFCFGVERAVKMAIDSVNEYDSVKTYGAIIHNPQVVENLQSMGIDVIEDIDDIKAEDTIVIRSHGVICEELDKIKSVSHSVINATCPFVLKAQNEAARLSKIVDCVIVYGESDHPEVKSIVSYIQSEYIIISNIEEIEQLVAEKKYGLVSQTTQSRELFKDLTFKLKLKCDRLEVSNTICDSTHRRQIAALELVEKVDIMIVIGGRNSANTRRLYDIVRSKCDRSYHVEVPEELDLLLLNEDDTVGLVAGASTPNEMVFSVKEYIENNFNFVIKS